MKSLLLVHCLDCRKPHCKHVLVELATVAPGPVQERALTLITETPGMSRAELGRLLWPKHNDYYTTKRAVGLAKKLERRGLIEYGVIREGGRVGVVGLYRAGQPRPVKPGYLGVNGWVSSRVRKNA